MSLPIFKPFFKQTARKIEKFLKKNEKKTMKMKKLDNFARRHFAERKVFYNGTLNRYFGGAQFYGSQRTKSMFSHVFLSLTYHPTSGRLMRKLLRNISYDVKQHALNFWSP